MGAGGGEYFGWQFGLAGLLWGMKRNCMYHGHAGLFELTGRFRVRIRHLPGQQRSIDVVR